ncbi:hypothetical protein MD484_g7703, partial [Candolleomyces efflorescens]
MQIEDSGAAIKDDTFDILARDSDYEEEEEEEEGIDSEDMIIE